MRNIFYDRGWFKSVSFEIPVISVGNLSTGGTGKTPMIEYLVRLLQKDIGVAVLSRGYGRKTSGFLIADESVDAEMIGDEPYQFFSKFENIQVAVDEDRVHGVSMLLKAPEPPEVVLLDDAFQHRRIRAGLSILLTTYEKPYSDALVLPAGDLREPRSGAKRADVIVVTKCPDTLKEGERKRILNRLNARSGQEVFFTGIKYASHAMGKEDRISMKELVSYHVLLVTGIANPAPLLKELSNEGVAFKHIRFGDHHNLTGQEQARIQKELEELPGESKVVITTEKDYVRNFETVELPVYYLPIETRFLDGENQFNQIIYDYVR